MCLYRFYDFICDEPTIDLNRFCIFHDINYLKGDNYEKHKEEVAMRFEEKLSEYSSNNMPLKFTGYCLPDMGYRFWKKQFTQALYFNNATFYGIANFYGATFCNETAFAAATFCKEANFSQATFSGKVYFSQATFSNKADFYGATFCKEANFSQATFSNEANSGKADFTMATFFNNISYTQAIFCNEAYFVKAKFYNESNFSQSIFSNETDFNRSIFLSEVYFSGEFNRKALFNYTIFEQPTKVIFDISNMSNVSFANTDITRIRFSETARWGVGKKDKNRFKVIEERWLEGAPEKIKNLGSLMAVYRNLRENYEFRLRYDEAGKFFIREMELKRRYREVLSHDGTVIIKRNCWFRRNLSLTGLYYHFSKYGESIARPTIIGAITIAISTLFWLTQKDPTKDPSLSNFVGAYWILINHHSNYLERAFERSLADFLPLLSLPSNIQVGMIDYIVKIVGGVLTFALLAIALRRKFERKYTR